MSTFSRCPQCCQPKSRQARVCKACHDKSTIDGKKTPDPTPRQIEAGKRAAMKARLKAYAKSPDHFLRQEAESYLKR